MFCPKFLFIWLAEDHICKAGLCTYLEWYAILLFEHQKPLMNNKTYTVNHPFLLVRHDYHTSNHSPINEPSFLGRSSLNLDGQIATHWESTKLLSNEISGNPLLFPGGFCLFGVVTAYAVLAYQLVRPSCRSLQISQIGGCPKKRWPPKIYGEIMVVLLANIFRHDFLNVKIGLRHRD